MCMMFAVLEAIEISRAVINHGASGIADYLQDMWNWLDWINFGCFGLAYWQVLTALASQRGKAECLSYMCHRVGYLDDWQVCTSYRHRPVQWPVPLLAPY